MILIVSRNKRRANQYSEMFHFMGILSHVATPHESYGEISLIYRAVLVLEPGTLPDPEDFVARLKSYSSVPIFSISEDGENDRYAHLFADAFREASFSGTVVGRMAEYSREHRASHVGDYRLGGINATPDLPAVRYFDRELPLTKTEAMILRYLIRTYPHPQKPTKILKYAYRPSRRPEISSIRAHVCFINRKFREMTGRNLIGAVDNLGYTLLAGEFLKTGALR